MRQTRKDPRFKSWSRDQLWKVARYYSAPTSMARAVRRHHEATTCPRPSHFNLYFVDRASRYKFLVITILTHFFMYLFISCLYMFRASQRSSSGLRNVLTFSHLMTYIYIYIYICRTAPLTSRCCILYIYSTNIRTEFFKHAAHSPFFPLQNAVYFIILPFLVPGLFTF